MQFACAAEVIPLGLFNDDINGRANRGACWGKSQRLGTRPDTARTHSHKVHSFADVITTDSLISLSLALSPFLIVTQIHRCWLCFAQLQCVLSALSHEEDY